MIIMAGSMALGRHAWYWSRELTSDLKVTGNKTGRLSPPPPSGIPPSKRLYLLFKDSYREREVENKEKLGLSLGMTMFIHGEGSFCHPSVDSQNAYREVGMWPLIGMEMTSVACKGSWEV